MFLLIPFSYREICYISGNDFPFKEELFNLKSQFSAKIFDEVVLPTQYSSRSDDTSRGFTNSTSVISNKRKVRSHSYLQDFHGYQLDHDHAFKNSCKTTHPLSSVPSYDKLSSSHRKFVCSISLHTEPDTYEQAVKDPDLQKVMELELEAMESNNAWIVTSLPEGNHPIACKWVYKLKFRYDGTLERARHV